MTDHINGPQPEAVQVNIEVTKTLRQLLNAAERGQIESIVVLGCDRNGNMIQAAHITDRNLIPLNTTIDCFKAKIVGRLISMENVGAHVSPIARAHQMPKI